MLSIDELLEAVKEIAGVSRDSELANLLGIRQSMISMWRKRGTIPYEFLLHFCEQRNIDMVWLLTGEGPRYRGESQPSPSRQIDLELMREVIETVEEVFERGNLSLAPEKKARLITLIYEEIAEDETKKASMEQKVVKLMKLAS